MVVSTRVTWNDFLVLSFSVSRTTLNETKYVLAWDPETSVSAKLYIVLLCIYLYTFFLQLHYFIKYHVINLICKHRSRVVFAIPLFGGNYFWLACSI